MSISKKFEAGSLFPVFTWPAVDGGKVTPAQGEDWRMLVIYRGAHCPLCTKYLHDLSRLVTQFDQLGIRLWALSSDPLNRAVAQVGREKWGMPILTDLQEEQMRDLGLYVSTPRSPQETDRNFAEPGLFVINPGSKVQIVDVSNAPFARPDPRSLLAGLKFVIENDYPIRGTAA